MMLRVLAQFVRSSLSVSIDRVSDGAGREIDHLNMARLRCWGGSATWTATQNAVASPDLRVVVGSDQAVRAGGIGPRLNPDKCPRREQSDRIVARVDFINRLIRPVSQEIETELRIDNTNV